MEMLLVHKRATQEKIESLKYVGLHCDFRFALMAKGKEEENGDEDEEGFELYFRTRGFDECGAGDGFCGE